MDSISFLNLEYIFITFYRAIYGVVPDDAPGLLLRTINTLETAGIVASLVLLVGMVYAHLRIEQIHHEVHHDRDHTVAERKGAHHAKNERWEHVISLMASASPSDWRQAIVEADIVLAELLEHFSIPGTTIGEKLKAVDRGSFTTLDLAWEAHKVRNEIAHGGSSYELTEREARRTVDLFRQVFEEFDYI